jgi:PIN domain nuclease of toxin-antitoxin system
MRLLLDTHTLFWSADDPTQLSPTALAAIQTPPTTGY